MSEESEHGDYLAVLSDPYFASPQRPLHLTVNNWDEDTRKIEDNIRDRHPFRGRWQSFVDEKSCLVIPEELRPLVEEGGVLSVSTNHHLMMFGKRHWNRMERELAKETGLSPVHTDRARHFFESLYRFDGLDENGAIELPVYLREYAGLESTVAIVGMVFHAEIHDRAAYMSTQDKKAKESLIARFRKTTFK